MTLPHAYLVVAGWATAITGLLVVCAAAGFMFRVTLDAATRGKQFTRDFLTVAMEMKKQGRL